MIDTQHLTKHYGDVHSVSDLSLSVGKGEIYGFLGLNGAGKTTTIRMLLGMIRPTSGTAFLNGEKVDAGNTALWNKVGYLVEVPYAYPDLTVYENLKIICRLRQLSETSIDIVIDKLQLGTYKHRKAKNLSLGNGQRLGLAKALIHRPSILILDEPSNGLDPSGIAYLRELLEDLAENHGVTIFISSHILGEISKLATRMGMIHEGRLIQEINASELHNHLQKKVLVDAIHKEIAYEKLFEAGFKVKTREDGLLEMMDERAVCYPEQIATMLVNEHVSLTKLNVEVEDLESYFLRMIGAPKK